MNQPVAAVGFEEEGREDDEDPDEGGGGHGVLVHQGRQNNRQHLNSDPDSSCRTQLSAYSGIILNY